MRTARLACLSTLVILLSACLPDADTQAVDAGEDGVNPHTAASIWKGLFCSNCSVYDNGYDWAEAKRITDPNDCRGTSQAFIRGCSAYATEQQLMQLVAAANQGNAQAQLELGTMYADGTGMARDFGKAAAWYRAAATLGDSNAQFRLAALYASGQGVPRDPVRARMWLNLAASSADGARHEVILAAREENGRRLTLAQVTGAQQMSDRCVASGYRNCD